jgi:diguanylate cyclase (GGDEF)-like protein
MPPKRRASDALRAVDGLVHTHLQHSPVDARQLANLAVAMVTEFSGAARGTLLLDEGQGLAPEFALGPGLRAAPLDATASDPDLVAEAKDTRRLVVKPDRLAAPVLLGGNVRGVIYLEAGDGRLDPESADLALGAATRIATLLHSATLLEDAARRARNVETIEAIGACLSAGALGNEHLSSTIDAALRATTSDEALLGILGERGELLDLHARGANRTALGAVADKVVAALLAHRLEDAIAGLGQPGLLEPFGADLLPVSGSLPARPIGFLAVRRLGAVAYSDADTTVFRALAHLLGAALARLAYFRKASEDTLTGTGSRLALELAIVEAVDHAKTAGLPLTIALIDVDHFKSVNDGHGHLVGDAALKAVAEALRSRLRARDYVARFGGDEFLVLLPQTGVAEAERVAEELRALVAGETHTEARLKLTLSIGIAAFPAHGATPRELVRRADEALYRSKTAGRNRVTVA